MTELSRATAMAQTSIDCYHRRVVPNISESQKQKILNVMTDGEDYTRRELGELTGLDRSTISARVNAMFPNESKPGQLENGLKRICKVTGEYVTTVRLPTIQQCLFFD